MTTYTITSGQTSTGITLSSGDTLTVLSGGTASTPTILGGGSETVFGRDVGTVISSGGSETVSSGGSASSDTISSGGSLIVSSGGSANPTRILGSETVLSGGIATSATILSGGFETISSGGSANLTTLLDGGTLILNGGAIDTGLTWSGGTLEIGAGFTLTSQAVSAGQTLDVLSGGTASATSLNGGLLNVQSGGTAFATTITDGGTETISGGFASSETIGSGGSLTVLSGGSASFDTIGNCGSMTVFSGGSADATTINGGTLEFGSGAMDTGLIWSSGTIIAGSLTSQVVGAGQTLVVFGGTVSAITLNNGGTELVSNGGVASSDTINSGGSVTVEAGARAAAEDLSATINSGGSMTVSAWGGAVSTAINSGGSMTIFGPANGGEAIAISPLINGSGAVLDLLTGAFVYSGITFKSTGGQLQIAGSAMPSTTISGFGSGDTFDLTSIAFDSAGTANLTPANVLQITEGGTTYDLNLDLGQFFTDDYFHLASDGSSGTLVSENNTPCFCRGTLILTERGEAAVEELAIGDRVVTLSGALQAIKWIGRRAYGGRFVAGNPAVLPIRIVADAIAEGLPARGLWVSPEHALYIDDLLVPARLLVNGATIRQVQSVARLEYFHIELDTHDVIFAEGVLAETYVDCDNCFMFQNGAEFARLYPNDDRPIWQFCAPRLEWNSPELTEIRTALLERVEALGHALDCDPDLHLIVDGGAIWPDSIAGERYRFHVPAGSAGVWLASRSAVPAEIEAGSRDHRRLGVPVERIVLFDAERSIAAWHDDAALSDGFHEDEDLQRWTDGLARLPEAWMCSFPGAFTLEVHLTPTGLGYPVLPPARIAAAA